MASISQELQAAARKFIIKSKPENKHSISKNGARDIIALYPNTIEDMNSIHQIVRELQLDPYVAKLGVVKVVPPQEWIDLNCSSGEDLIQKIRSLRVPKENPGVQSIDALPFGPFNERSLENEEIVPGAYQISTADTKKTIAPFKSVDVIKKFIDCQPQTIEVYQNQLNKFWKFVEKQKKNRQQTYYAGFPGHLFKDEDHFLNYNHKSNEVNDLFKEISGIYQPFTFIGSKKTAFPWHQEDARLISYNYQHVGKPKVWHT